MNSMERGLLLLLAGVVVFDHVGTARAGGDSRVYAGAEFTLLTDQGRTVGSFRISPEGLPELVMADGKGHGRIIIGVKGTDDAIIGITDSAGKVRAGLIGDAEGQHSLQLTDATMVPRLDLAVTAKGVPRISVVSAKNKELIGLGVDAGEGSPALNHERDRGFPAPVRHRHHAVRIRARPSRKGGSTASRARNRQLECFSCVRPGSHGEGSGRARGLR